jgi:hypothetical protein
MSNTIKKEPNNKNIKIKLNKLTTLVNNLKSTNEISENDKKFLENTSKYITMREKIGLENNNPWANENNKTSTGGGLKKKSKKTLSKKPKKTVSKKPKKTVSKKTKKTASKKP